LSPPPLFTTSFLYYDVNIDNRLGKLAHQIGERRDEANTLLQTTQPTTPKN